MSITCSNPTSRAGRERSATKFIACLLFCLFCASPCSARDAWTVSRWLCDHVFSGPGATLALCENGFFGLRLENGKKEIQNIAGLWRLGPDGIQLTLQNLQDSQLHMTVGNEAIHAILPNLGPTTLFPAPFKPLQFKIIGMLTKTPEGLVLQDASSGMSFAVPDSDAQPDKFATALLEITREGPKINRLLSHSRQVPRSWSTPKAVSDEQTFLAKVAQRPWLLPPGLHESQGAFRMSQPVKQKGNTYNGTFEISGPGLRLDGKYILEEDKLTLAADHASVRNLKLLGASAISETFLGQHRWQFSSRGLELECKGQKVLLMPYMP